MVFKELLNKLGSRQRRKKELLKQLDEQNQVEETLEQRKLSSNERELNRYLKEDREEKIKEALHFYRKKRENDIHYNHNPLNIKNITNYTDWEVLKERNLFNKKGNMFSGQGFIHKNNPNLLKNNKKMYGV